MTVTDEPAPPAPDQLGAAIAALTAQLADVRRLALSGSRAGVEPLAVPSTGLIPDVTDGALIESAWGVAIGGSQSRIVNRFDNYAQLKSQWSAAPDGACAVTIDDGRLYVRRAARWYTSFMWTSPSLTADAAGIINIAANATAVNLDVIINAVGDAGWNADPTQWFASSSRVTGGSVNVRIYKLSAAAGGTVLPAANIAVTTMTVWFYGYRT